MIHVFYHSADLDGMCSGAIVKHVFTDCELYGINYGQDFPWDKIQQDDTVFMVDFGLQPFDGMVRLNGMCKLHWIDHHKTALDDAYKAGFLASGGQLLVDGRSGCELTWEYVSNMRDPGNPSLPPEPLAVHLLGRYDVWDHSDPRALQFQYGMRQFKDTYPENQELWQRAFYSEGFTDMVVKDGRLLLEYEDSQNAKFCKAYAFETELCLGHKDCPTEWPTHMFPAVCVNRGFTNSKVFDSVYDPTKHLLMITFCRLKLPARKWTVSLYSTRDDVDCGAIAREFGGGGHRGAAGFQCENLPFDH